MTLKSESLNDIRGALNDQLRPDDRDDDLYPWIWELFIEPLEAIVNNDDGQYFRASVTMDGDEPVLAPESEWVEVERVWVEKSMHRSALTKAAGDRDKPALTDLLVYQGGAIKALGDGKVGGHLVIFSGPDDPDLEGDFFDASTDFDLFDGKLSSVYFEHGLDPVLKNTRLGRGPMQEDGDVGVWIEAKLEMRNQYEQAVYELADAGKLGWSSGTAPSLIATEPVGKSTHIKTWPLGLDASLTVMPAEPRTQAIPLKSYAKSFSVDLQGAVKELLEGAGEAPAAVDMATWGPREWAEVLSIFQEARNEFTGG